MRVTKHERKKTGAIYWIASPDNDSDKSLLDNSAAWQPAKFGGGYLTYDEATGKSMEEYCGGATEANSEGHDMDYGKMTVTELRKIVREKGWTGAEVLNASKQDLVSFLETGDKPAGNANSEEIGKQLAELIAKLGGNSGVDEEAVREIVQREMVNAVHRIEIVTTEANTIPAGIQHYMFETLLRIASCAETDEDGNVKLRPIDAMLVGPAGSGKTHVCHAIATALGVNFYPFSVGAMTTDSKLLGYMDANGKFVASPLYTAYKEGGLYLLDELDAGNANSITVLNALTANGAYTFPNGEYVKRHPNFICFAAANTFGRGADRLYVGRNQLDAASLDRFVVVEFDYDEALERVLAGASPRGNNKKYTYTGTPCTTDQWVTRVQAYRGAAAELKERIVISPRASMKGSMLLAAGFGLEQVESMCIWKGTDAAIVQKIKAKANMG